MQKQYPINKVVSRPRAVAVNLLVCHEDFRRAAILLALASLFSATSARGDSLTTDSVLIAKHNNRAADFYEKGNFASAKAEYIAVIGFAPNAVEPYEGLLSCAKQTQDWSDVAFAAEKISALSPERKPVYEFDYGTALYHLNRYDEAIPHLKSALATASLPEPTFKPIKIEAQNNSNGVRVLPIENAPRHSNPGTSTAPVTSSQDRERHEQDNTVTSVSPVNVAQLENFENAIRSEFICIAEYQGFDKAKDIRFNSPVASHWRIDRILKGPPLNKSLPLRYDFHTLSEKQAPAGWRFDESKMPEKGSMWILFIEYAVPDGPKQLFTTYGGSYGRQSATEANLNELDRLLEEHHMKIQGL
jgi:hypothetical protein